MRSGTMMVMITKRMFIKILWMFVFAPRVTLGGVCMHALNVKITARAMIRRFLD